MATRLNKFVQKRDRGMNGDSAPKSPLSPADRQRLGQQLRFNAEAGSPGYAKMGTPKNEHYKDDRRSTDIKGERDMWDTDVDSIGDTTTMTSKERDVPEQRQGTYGAEAQDEAAKRPTNLTSFLRDGEGPAFEESKSQLYKNLQSVSNSQPAKREHGKADYPSTSPSEADFHQGLPLHGHRIQKDSERDQTAARGWDNEFAKPNDVKDSSKRVENPDRPVAPPAYSMPPPKQPARADRSRPRPVSRGHGPAPTPTPDVALPLPQRGVSRKAERHPEARVDEPTRSHKRPLDSEHTLEELRGMKYADLKEEPFERGPKDTSVALPDKVNSASLAAKLDYLRALPESSDDTLESNLQYRFFSLLPIAEYDACGDILLGQFEAMLGRMRTVRQDKRRAAVEFEGEIEARVNALQRQKEDLDKNLATLKTKGEDVIKQ